MKEALAHILSAILIYGIVSLLFYYFIDGTIQWTSIITFSVLMSLGDYFIIRKIKERFEKKKQK